MKSKNPILIGFQGTTLTDDWKRHLEEVNPFGVIFFQRNIQSLEQTGALIKEIVDLLGEVVLSIDHEGGQVNRFGNLAACPPTAYSLGQSKDLELVRKAAKMQAELLSHLDFTMNFAPVLDLYDPTSKAIGWRAFSESPAEVATCGKIIVQEHLRQNIIPVGKHFPGHGRVEADSHFQQGVVAMGRSELEQDIAPFRDLIQAGIPALMTAHLIYEGLDAANPATLSKIINQEILREELGFKGVLISDCLEMAGVAEGYQPKEMVSLGREAGMDLWMSSYSLAKSMDFQKALARELEANRDEASAERLAQLQSAHKSSLIRGNQTELPQKQDAYDLRSKVLSKIKESDFVAPKEWVLVELTQTENKGVNAGENWGNLSSVILQSSLISQSSLVIRHKAVIVNCEGGIFQEMADLACKDGIGLLLVTNKASSQLGFTQIMQAIKKVPLSLHICVSGKMDLQGAAKEEWAIYGYDVQYNPVILSEIKLRCTLDSSNSDYSH